MYIYPHNLKERPMIWLWRIKDALIFGIGVLLSVVILINFNWMLPLVLSMIYAILAIRIDDYSIASFLGNAINYFLISPQEYDWQHNHHDRN